MERLLGKTITSIEGLKVESEEVLFVCEDGSKFKMFHEQDCCESVSVEDVNGNIENILNSPILKADEKSNNGENDYGTETFTFYTIATINGFVDIRWHGESNGYYSEEVTFKQTLNSKE